MFLKADLSSQPAITDSRSLAEDTNSRSFIGDLHF